MEREFIIAANQVHKVVSDIGINISHEVLISLYVILFVIKNIFKFLILLAIALILFLIIYLNL